ncbi:MAG: YhbY family RNA-binding protein [Rhizobacter sp.]|nr:YhbY family RNA-binding protein [Burkholderiaceae bacterium]MCO5122121.1 YhbY family RNA-binding protein [Rhizobacter sp.]
MTAIELRPAQRKDQRALAHHLDPVAMIGGDGLTPAVVREIDHALSAHGLIKVRVLSDDRAAREAMLAQLADELGAAPIQHIGKLLVLWRPMPPKEKLPREDRGAGPKVVKVLKFSKSGNHRPQVKKIKVLGNQRVAAGGELKRARKRVTTSPKKAASR